MKKNSRQFYFFRKMGKNELDIVFFKAL